MIIERWLNDLIVHSVYLERRIDPYFRDAFDRILQKPLVALTQFLINLKRKDDHLQIGEEKLLANEAEITGQIIETMGAFLRQHYPHGNVQRAGNTKTYGVVRGEFEILPDLPVSYRQGLFARARTYPAWVRFAGPGPLAPPDLEDNGIMSIGIKLMGVEGDKLLEDEKWTQDFTGISAPSFTTPDIIENLKLQKSLLKGTPALYFLNPFDSHYLDMLMQGLYARTNSSPLDARYYSCVPYRWGEQGAMQYSVKPRSAQKAKIPKNPSPDYLREAMAERLHREAVEFDFMVQVQTDPFRMPLENASVVWPEKLSPYVKVAKLRLPVQKFDSPRQLAFAGNLSYNPWHCIAAHRPLGNQNRTRKALYLELSKLRQTMSGEARIEPTGQETFDD